MYRPNLQSVVLPVPEIIRRSRSSKVIDFGTNRKRVCDSLLVRKSNPGSIFVLLSNPIPIPPCWRRCEQVAYLGYSAVNLFSKYSNCAKIMYLNVTDRRTLRTDDLLWNNRTALCVAWHGVSLFGPPGIARENTAQFIVVHVYYTVSQKNTHVR